MPKVESKANLWAQTCILKAVCQYAYLAKQH